jgi:hypothetical protein
MVTQNNPSVSIAGTITRARWIPSPAGEKIHIIFRVFGFVPRIEFLPIHFDMKEHQEHSRSSFVSQDRITEVVALAEATFAKHRGAPPGMTVIDRANMYQA